MGVGRVGIGGMVVVPMVVVVVVPVVMAMRRTMIVAVMMVSVIGHFQSADPGAEAVAMPALRYIRARC